MPTEEKTNRGGRATGKKQQTEGKTEEEMRQKVLDRGIKGEGERDREREGESTFDRVRKGGNESEREGVCLRTEQPALACWLKQRLLGNK